MTVATIRKLRSGGAVVELPNMLPHWFPDHHVAIAEAVNQQMRYELLEPEEHPAPVVVLASALT